MRVRKHPLPIVRKGGDATDPLSYLKDELDVQGYASQRGQA